MNETKIIINGVEYVPKIKKIEDVHKENNDFIKKYNLKIGDIIETINKDNKTNLLQITHIHNIYGWITAIYIKTGSTASMVPPSNIRKIYNIKYTEVL